MKRQEAERIANTYLASRPEFKNCPVEIVDEFTIEKPFGWIFVYQSSQYFKTGLVEHMLAGNGPILVENNGNIVKFPCAIPTEEAIKRYEAGLPLLPQPKSNL